MTRVPPLTLTGILIVVGTSQPVAEKPSQQPLMISVSPVEVEVRPGSSVALRIQSTNIPNHHLTVSAVYRGGGVDYSYEHEVG